MMFREKFYQWFAAMLPRDAVYFAIIRAWAHATTGRFGATHAPDLLVEDMINRWTKTNDAAPDNGPEVG